MDIPAQAGSRSRPSDDVWDVLAVQADGHRTVHRVSAPDRVAAEQEVGRSLHDGARLLGSAMARVGLGLSA